MKTPAETRTVPELQPVVDAVAAVGRLRSQLAKAIVGQERVVDLALTALLCEGHVLFEGVPGLGKTLLVRSLAQTLSLTFSRVQFTPDLMPADVVGSTVIVQDGSQNYGLKFEPGPVFAHLVLADEINRASPKTQSALLEAMQERAVTIRGQRHDLPRPFQVLATQNPLEMEGTYPLPEAQVDRFFFKVLVGHPSLEDLMAIVERTSGTEVPVLEPCLDAVRLKLLQKAVRDVEVPSSVTEFAARIVLATQPENEGAPEEVRRWVRYGSGPRGAQTLILAAKARALLDGRFFAGFDDVEALVEPSLGHRLALNFDGQSQGVAVRTLLASVVAAVRKTKDWPAVLRKA
jgi:MoxR-like ATPase